jgi:23S rRNA pseudouridine1911/1915/1917 synthase
VISEIVPAALGGERLDRIVAIILDLPRSAAATVVAEGGATIDGVVERSGKVRLAEGQTVTADPSLAPTVGPPEPDDAVDFTVVHVDEQIIVIDKPAGLVVHPGAGNTSGTLVNGLLAAFPEITDVGEPHRPGIVHRLDAGSTGLVVVARTPDAYESLVAQFADHRASRHYMALVWGHLDAAHGIIDAPIGRSRRDPLKMAVVADGRPARTEYEVRGRFAAPAPCSLLECRLETGRTHQIRVHLSSIDHPLIGDPVYGQRRPTLGLSRPFLHAAHLEFDHPADGVRVSFDSELATDLQAMLDGLESAD